MRQIHISFYVRTECSNKISIKICQILSFLAWDVSTVITCSMVKSNQFIVPIMSGILVPTPRPCVLCSTYSHPFSQTLPVPPFLSHCPVFESLIFCFFSTNIPLLESSLKFFSRLVLLTYVCTHHSSPGFSSPGTSLLFLCCTQISLPT